MYKRKKKRPGTALFEESKTLCHVCNEMLPCLWRYLNFMMMCRDQCDQMVASKVAQFDKKVGMVV